MVGNQFAGSGIGSAICRSCWVALAMIWLQVASQPGTIAAADSTAEYEVKAAMIYNFALFVEWPEGNGGPPNPPLVLCALGQDPFGAALENTFRGKTVGGRNLAIRRFSKLAELQQPCHMLFVSRSESEQLPEILRSLGSAPVLTLGDIKDFAGLGGIIGFTLEDSKVGFEINLEAAHRAGLKISYKLLRLATVRARATGGEE